MSDSAEALNYCERFDIAVKSAFEQGFEVIHGTTTTLLLDLDTEDALRQCAAVLPIIDDKYGIAHVQTWLSKSGNRHSVVELNTDLTAVERVALQAALGSDGRREALAIFLIQAGIAEPSLLFRPPGSLISNTDKGIF